MAIQFFFSTWGGCTWFSTATTAAAAAAADDDDDDDDVDVDVVFYFTLQTTEWQLDFLVQNIPKPYL